MKFYAALALAALLLGELDSGKLFEWNISDFEFESCHYRVEIDV